MKQLYYLFIILFVGCVSSLFADGLLLPADENYPVDFLRNKITKVDVTINGLVAETVVYQEFINEWTESVDAVYNFPLPDNARSTMLLYTRNDTTFRAVYESGNGRGWNRGTGE